MKLDKKQLEIAHSNHKKIVVASLSGSGKTAVLTERVRWLLEKGEDPQGIVAITFTNAAAEEMIERIGPRAKRAFIGTIHSYANQLLVTNGISTQYLIDREKFDKFFNLIQKNLHVVKPITHLLVDEFQDIDDLQYNFLFNNINAENIFVIGDDSQNIYSFRGANVKHFYDFTKNPNFKYYTMDNNYRTGVDIVRFGMKFLKPIPKRLIRNYVCKNPVSGTVLELPVPDLEIISKEILDSGHFKDWFILVRYNKDILPIINFLQEKNIPVETFKKGDLSTKDLQKKMESDTVKILTVHTAKGLENSNVVVIGVVPYNHDERRLAYVAATRAKTKLIWCYNKKRKPKPVIYDW